MGSKRGQVTVFAVLGIVILVVIIFAIAVTSSLSKLKLQGEASKAVDAYLQSEAINYYVYTCMDTAVTSAIDDLALQGGVFYKYQNGSFNALEQNIGTTHIPYSLEFESPEGGSRILDFNVSYSVLNHSEFRCDLVAKPIPQYPLNRTFITNLYDIYNERTNICLYNQKEGYALSGFAGLNNMTRLCYIGGSPNIRSITADMADAERDTEIRSLPSHCFDNYIMDKNRSVEYILSEQISKRVNDCVNFSLFTDDNITPLGFPVTSITYTSDSVFAETIFNFSVKIKNKEPVIVKHSFKYKSDLRIVRMHNYVMTLVKADSQDFLFNLQSNYENYPLHASINPQKFFDEEHMSVKVINFSECTTGPCLKYKYDRLLIVEDELSKIGNRSLTYLTMLQNRRPALDFIHTSSVLDANYDIVVSTNENLTIDPFGYDPDDKPVTEYAYDGWKETYDEECQLSDEPINGVYTVNCIRVPNPQLPFWTNSNLFENTRRKANYTTKESDVGPHEFTVTVTDESGLQDYQTVKVLVFDLPKAIIELQSFYPSIESEITSVEDPIILDGSSSHGSRYPNQGGEITKYIWNIFHNPLGDNELVFTSQQTDPRSYAPVQYVDTLTEDQLNELIQQIKPRAPPDELGLNHTGPHNITLVVQANVALMDELVYSEPAGKTVQTYECLPHRNSNDPYPYPYNAGDNPFFANHVCCSLDNGLLDNEECFETTWYGEYASLLDLDYFIKEEELSIYLPTPQSPTTTGQTNTGNNKNDVFEMTFERLCDGNRGNICAGAMTRTFTVYKSCADLGVGETERCEGPDPNPSENIQNCISYEEGNSFEKAFNIGATASARDGICNENKECSTIGENGYKVFGPMLCVATCSGGECDNARFSGSECACSASCGAECTSENSVVWQNFICKNNCATTSTCTYQSTALPCNSNSAHCKYVGTNPSFTNNMCYNQVSCTASGSNYNAGELCIPGTTIPTPGSQEGALGCVTTSSTCNELGDCRPLDYLPATCQPGMQRVCQTTGWACIGNPN
ncbi:MAG: hypothetical protein ACP5N2_06835 [Candidatus Nanoarchaeia archaeon]